MPRKRGKLRGEKNQAVESVFLESPRYSFIKVWISLYHKAELDTDEVSARIEEVGVLEKAFFALKPCKNQLFSSRKTFNVVSAAEEGLAEELSQHYRTLIFYYLTRFLWRHDATALTSSVDYAQRLWNINSAPSSIDEDCLWVCVFFQAERQRKTACKDYNNNKSTLRRALTEVRQQFDYLSDKRKESNITDIRRHIIMQSLLSRSKIFTMLRRIAAEKKRRSLGHVALEYALGALRRAHTKQKSYNRLQVASALWNCLLDLQTSIKQGAHGLVINFQQLVTSFQSDIRACRLDGLDLSYVTKLQEITREKTPPAQHQVPYTKLRSFLQELETKAKMERKTQPSRKRGDVRHRR